MANWSLPTITDLYTNVISYFKSRDDDCATMFDVGTPSNVPTGAIKWASANNRFEIWSGSAWVELTSKYLFDVDTVDGLHGAQFLRSDVADSASGNLTFSGDIDFTGGIDINSVPMIKSAAELNRVNASSRVSAHLTTTGVSVPNTGTTIVPFNVVNFDTKSELTPGASASFDPVEDGYYLVTTNLTFDTTAWSVGDQISLQILTIVGAGDKITIKYAEHTSAQYLSLQATAILFLNGGVDSVSIGISQTSSAAKNLFVGRSYVGVEIARLL